MDELHNRDHNIRTDAFFLFFWLRRSHRGVEKTKSIHETLTVRKAETEVKMPHTANTGSKWWTFSWDRQTLFMGSSVILSWKQWRTGMISVPFFSLGVLLKLGYHGVSSDTISSCYMCKQNHTFLLTRWVEVFLVNIIDRPLYYKFLDYPRSI